MLLAGKGLSLDTHWDSGGRNRELWKGPRVESRKPTGRCLPVARRRILCRIEVVGSRLWLLESEAYAATLEAKDRTAGEVAQPTRPRA